MLARVRRKAGKSKSDRHGHIDRLWSTSGCEEKVGRRGKTVGNTEIEWGFYNHISYKFVNRRFASKLGSS